MAADGITDYILKTSFSFKQNTFQTVFITGECSSISALFTDDDLTNPPTGKAKIRFVNLSPDAGNLMHKKTALPSFPTRLINQLQFVNFDPGVYDLQLKSATGTVLLEKNVTVTAGIIYTAWANGMRAGISNSP